MRKIFLIMLCMVLLVGTISAGELLSFDNVKQYDEGTKTITIVNTFGLGRDISTIQLNTPLNVMVSTGYQKVAEFEVNLFDDTYSSAFDKMEFYNKKNMDRIDREFDYKYLAIELVDVNDYKESCSTSGNGTKVCEQVIIGTHQKEKEVWEDLDTSILTKGKVTIGIFTNVQVGDYVEWIPTLFGKEIDEWATWTASLNVGLVSWYKLDETTGVVLDSRYVNNGTNYNATRGVSGIIGNAFNFNESNIGVHYGTSSSLSIAGNLSISAWIKPNQGSSNIRAIFTDWSGTNKNYIFWINSNGSIRFSNGNGASSEEDSWSDALPDDGEWHHVVVTRDISGNNASIYIDGTLNISSSLTLDGGATSNNVSLGFWAFNNGLFMEGLIDEVGVWNRTLTNEEAIILFSEGLGCTLNTCITGSPIITLNSPIDNSKLVNVLTTFNGSVVAFENNAVVNVSLIINNTYIETNTSGINNTNYIFTQTLSNNYYNWTYESCGDNNVCTNATVRTFTVTPIIEEEIFYNTTSYETQGETFTINITTNGTYTTSAVFHYNGVSQGASTKTGTDTNANFSNTIQIPIGNGSKEFYWKITLGSLTEDSTKTNQTVNETVWTYCNATYTVPFLNVSFKDEADLSFINATIPTSNFIYYLGDGTVTKTYTYVNATENYYYYFCASPNLTMIVNPYIQYKQGTDYPQRIYDPDIISYTNDTTDLTLYLLGVSDGIYVTFQVINTANLVLSGVDMNASREISGTDVEVGTGVTGADGGVTLWLNPDFIHDFTFNKSGFPVLYESFAPTQSAYTITLGGETTPEYSYFRGVDYSILPIDSSLTNDTAYTFGFNLTSTFWDLTEYGFNLRLVNGTIITGGSTSTSGTPLTKSYNTNNQTKVYIDYYWFINETYTNGTRLWLVYNTLNTQWSIGTFFTDFNDYMDSGFFGIDDFGRYLIIFIVIFFSVGIMSYKFGFTSPVNISVMTFLIVFFFDVVVGIIPPLSVFSGTEVNYLLTFLTGLIAVMVVLREATRV